MKLTGPVLAIAAGSLALTASAQPQSTTLERGRQILEANCQRCHATGKDGASARPDAPPLRTIVTRYPASDLAEALAEGIVSGHPDMPEFTFEPDDIDAIIAYLDSLAGNN